MAEGTEEGEDSPTIRQRDGSAPRNGHVIRGPVVCPKCSGEGKIRQPAFDGMSLSEIETIARDDFMDTCLADTSVLPMQGAHQRQRV